MEPGRRYSIYMCRKQTDVLMDRSLYLILDCLGHRVFHALFDYANLLSLKVFVFDNGVRGRVSGMAMAVQWLKPGL